MLHIFIKSLFDYVLGVALLIVLSPLFLLIAIFIKIDSKGPVFFRQDRVGKDGKVFIIFKFRTMVDNAANIGPGLALAENDSRITPIGNFLREWSLDELPQLLNIVKGEMSIIGPRPTLKYQTDQYNDFQKRRLLMKPGVTGWAQVNGRNSLSWEERIKLDVRYVENYSFWLDMKILLKTGSVAIFRKGLYGADGTNDNFNLEQKD